MAGTYRPNKPQIEARREYAAKLKARGISVSTIVRDINEKKQNKGWGIVNDRMIREDISIYYSYQPPLTAADFAEIRGIRAARLAQLDGNIESLALQISRTDLDEKTTGKKLWKPFERADIITRKAQLEREYMEMENWNYSKFNPHAAILVEGTASIAGQFEAASLEAKTAEQGAFTPFLDGLRATIQRQKAIEEGVISVPETEEKSPEVTEVEVVAAESVEPQATEFNLSD